MTKSACQNYCKLFYYLFCLNRYLKYNIRHAISSLIYILNQISCMEYKILSNIQYQTSNKILNIIYKIVIPSKYIRYL